MNKYFELLFGIVCSIFIIFTNSRAQKVEFGAHWWNAYQLTNEFVFNTEKDIAKEAGLKWIRATFDWSEIQPSPNSFDENYISVMEKNIDALKGDGFEVIAMLLWSPKWASSYSFADIDSAKHWAPADTSIWKNFVGNIVSRFKDKVHYWEIWNEQDGSYFNTSPGTFQNISRASAYSQFLKSGYRKIKSIDPDSKILFGGLTSEAASNPLKKEFMDSLFIRYNAADFIDIMNIHVYVNAKSLVDTLSDRWDKYRLTGKAFWITETSNFRANNSGYLSESVSAAFFCEWLKDSVVAKFRHFNQNNKYDLPFVVLWFPLENKREGYPPFPMDWGLIDSTGNKTELFDECKSCVSLLTDVDKKKDLPNEFVLKQNYPNPFNPSTTIEYTIPTSLLNPSPYQGEGHRERLVTLKVYDILGCEVATLVNEYQQPGHYSAQFNVETRHSAGAERLYQAAFIFIR
ncbi:MAG: hypothetical protein AB1775_09790 [Bacteroidota bacterium]